MLHYIQDTVKMSVSGLQLNVPPDQVPPTEYSRLTNAVSQIEGELQTRSGIASVASFGGGSLHTLFQLNEFSAGIPSLFLVGEGANLWQSNLPIGVFSKLTPMFDTTPLSVAAFRFDADPNYWAIVANAFGMWKIKSGYVQPLGVAPPTVAPVASVGNAGNLNGSYDWLYTYINPVTLSESDSSPLQVTSPPATPAMTTFNNPSLYKGDGLTQFFNPGNAIDGNLATFATGAGGLGPSGGNASCDWIGATGTASSTVLNVTHSGTTNVNLVGDNLQILYSLDGGTIFNTLFLSQNTYSTRTDQIAIPNGTDLSKVIVTSVAQITTGVAATDTIKIYEIFFTVAASSSNQLALTNQIGKVCVGAPPAGTQGTSIGLYRRGGTLNDNYRQIGIFPSASLSQGTCGAGTLEIDDNNTDASIAANNLIQLDNDRPVTSVQKVAQPLSQVWAYPAIARLLACGDPARPNAVYFSKSGNADEWPPQNWVSVCKPGDQMMNGLVYDYRCFAFSRQGLHVLLPNIISGVTLTPSETSCRRGLKGRFAFTVGAKGIYFVASDGVFRTQGGSEESVIDNSIKPLFPVRENQVGISVGPYDAVNMADEDGLRLSYINGEIYFHYTGLNTGQKQLLIYDEVRNRWRSAVPTPLMQTSYRPDASPNLLYLGGTDSKLYLAGTTGGDSGQSITVDFRTGAFDQGAPLNLKEYGSVAVDLDPGGATTNSPVTITPRINGDTVVEAAVTVTGSGRQRVPLSLADPITLQERYGLNLSLDFSWSADAAATVRPIIYQVTIFYRREPSAFQHWEVPPSTLSQIGWFHVKDAFITLRSTASVTFTFTPDNGVPQAITIPSTGGAKQKVYVPFAANKIKLAQFAMDSTQDFRVYQDESEVRVKAWQTRLGYQPVPALGREIIGNQNAT